MNKLIIGLSALVFALSVYSTEGLGLLTHPGHKKGQCLQKIAAPSQLVLIKQIRKQSKVKVQRLKQKLLQAKKIKKSLLLNHKSQKQDVLALAQTVALLKIELANIQQKKQAKILFDVLKPGQRIALVQCRQLKKKIGKKKPRKAKKDNINLITVN
jgi:hypothetical protein